MEKYNVTGMSCAACSARVEKAVNSVEGVEECSVSLLTNSMSVGGSASPDEIIKAVEAAGYGASLQGDNIQYGGEKSDLKDTETPKIRKRLLLSLLFLFPLMYMSMGHSMWSFPLPAFLDSNPVALGLAQLLLSVTVIVINQKFFINGFKGVIHRAPNMDTLVSLGSGASFIYSTVQLFMMSAYQMNGDLKGVGDCVNELYFESAAMILVLITVGKMLESYSKGKTTDALKGLMSLAPETAVLLRDGKEVTVPVSMVNVGDIFVVRSGERIPVDGDIIEGTAALDESALTGESIPVDKTEGERVYAATINSSGYIRCCASGVGSDTTLSKIIKLVSDTAASKAPIAKVADKVSGVFVPVVIGIGMLAFFIWLAVGSGFGFALSRGITVLVISCPCALGLATPVAIMVGSGKGAKNGILFKTAAALEETGRVKIVALDKTGTITKGEPQVTDIIPNKIDEDQLLSLAYSLEIKSEHPLARAIVRCAEERSAELIKSKDFEVIAGSGVSALIKNKKVRGGSLAFISGNTKISEELRKKAEELSNGGKTPLLFTVGRQLAGIIAVADVVKEDSAEAVKELQNMGIRVVMLTGDNKNTADAIGKQVGVDAVISDVMPDGKEAIISALCEQGKVAMVGDGINDAPALTRADIGIAVSSGTDIAADAADIVLMNNRLSDVPAAIRLSRATLRNIYENLFWAFIYNVIGIPLAAGLFIPMTGWLLKPVFGAAAMSLSSFCVVSNALRLNLFRVHDSSGDKKAGPIEFEIPEINNKENDTMTKTMKIEGMMCAHCEKAVKTALEALDGVAEAVPSHTENKAVLTLTEDVDDALLTKTVEELEYKVTGIE
ncbi:MAG: heavy metal translocating P-type ATPase [Eubacterium sp.]|nr:heavy metal translocating P-type ATPase [Eubacterium sp.]